MTLNKAQGKTFSRGLLLLTRDVFAHGQLYVGLTRFGAASDVAVLVSPERRIDGRAVVLNVVSSSLAQPVYQEFDSLRPATAALDLLRLNGNGTPIIHSLEHKLNKLIKIRK